MPIVWTQDPAANELLETDALALLIGMVLDQQVKMEKAFGGPYELKQRLGHLDARGIASMDPEALDKVFRERPALHRFPGNMARRVQAMCAVVAKDYGGGAGGGGGGAPKGADPSRPSFKHAGCWVDANGHTVDTVAQQRGGEARGW